MRRRIVAPAIAVLVAAAMAAVNAGSANGTGGPAGANAGPPYNFVTELMGVPGGAVPLKDKAILEKTNLGYRFRAGQQNGHLVVTRVAGGLRFVDRGTDTWKRRTPACDRQQVERGIAAVCRLPRDITVRRPLLVEVWPRLGDDYTDTSTLPATFAVTVLGDKGRDVARLGAGPDFFNGFSSRDRVWGGGGNDWIRPGLGNDAVTGGAGNDDIVAREGHDTIRGGKGADRLWGGPGDDRLLAGAGTDFVLCGNGRDRAWVGAGDRAARNCEAVN